MDVKEVRRLIGVVVHPVHGGAEGKDTFVHVLLLITVNVSRPTCLADVVLATGAQLLQAEAAMFHVVVFDHLHLLPWQQTVFFVVRVEEMSLAVRTTLADGIQSDVSSDVGGIQMTDEPIRYVRRKLRPCQSGNVLNPPGARFGKTVHVEESGVRLVDEQDEEEGEEPSQDVYIRLLDESDGFGNLVDGIRVHTYGDVDCHGEPYQEVRRDLLEAGAAPE
mmetsp:Transcript_12643/g.30851  ORF Transcript_12643/g.30851 Transcript_12643/m.30851 type:complete len:220 (+) Transcript_12643:648-1307(+)